MIVDAWDKGLRIYSSENGRDTWTYSSTITGSHPSIYSINGKFIFLCHGSAGKARLKSDRETALYIGELLYENGRFIRSN